MSPPWTRLGAPALWLTIRIDLDAEPKPGCNRNVNAKTD